MGFIKKPEDDMYIALLKLGENVGLKGISEGDLFDWATNLNYLPPEGSEGLSDLKGRLYRLYDESFQRPPGATTINVPRILKVESYFRLLEHRELNEARKSAKSAWRFSMVAIIISVVSLVASIFMSVSIDESQIERIEKSIQQLRD